MRVLFTTVAGYGHLHPLLPLALAAAASGDEVRVATGTSMGAWVTSCGVPHAPAGRNGLESFTPAEREQLDGYGPLRAHHLFTTFAVPPMIRDLLALCEQWRPDVIVHEETEFAGPLVAELLGVPCATQSYAAPARPVEQATIQRDLLVPIWREHTTATPRLTGDVYLDACPPPFQTDAVRPIPNVRQVRPVGFDGPPDDPPPAWLEALPRPAAYVTFGTVGAFSRLDVIQETVDALASADVVPGLVVTTGPNGTETLRLPAGAFAERYVRQSHILGSVDVVVSHGGAGTTLGAIEHALPHVVIPQQPFSQLRNAERVQALAIGVHVPQGQHAAVGPAVARVLEDPTYAANVTAMRDDLDRLPGPTEVLEHLRTLAR